MHIKEKHLQLLPTLQNALLAVAVFCYWMWIAPHLLFYRESMQLFLWTEDYLSERLAVPGGFAQYLGECIVQLFLNPAIGAGCYALMAVMTKIISARLLSSVITDKVRWSWLTLLPPLVLWYITTVPTIPMTVPVALLLTITLMAILPDNPRSSMWLTIVLVPTGYWLLGPAIVLLPLYHLRFLHRAQRFHIVTVVLGTLLLLAGSVVASSRIVAYPLRMLAHGIDYHWAPELMGDEEEMIYDMLSRRHRWATIVNRYNAHPSDNPAILAVAKFALYHEGMIERQELLQGLAPSFRSQNSIPAMQMISEVYLRVGFVTMSQRNAFEAMEGIPNCNKSARSLYRLVETNLITGQYEVALKYITILEHTLMYRSWANKMRRLVEHPQRIRNHVFYHELQLVYNATPDAFF